MGWQYRHHSDRPDLSLPSYLHSDPAPTDEVGRLRFCARYPLITRGSDANVFLLLIPLSIGIAILRYRLYDIDILINRTLVYGTLTVLLAVVYIGSIVLLQQLFLQLTGQRQSALVTVISTLAIAALFQPLRRRIQGVIDRRFYRRKYDAARTLADFSATLREQVDLEQLNERLVAVVEETMQPSHVFLWLRKSGHERKPGTRV